MKTLLVFDPPMCCSTGVCGPDVDPALVQFAADLKWLAGRGVTVARYNLSQEPEAFVQERAVYDLINEAGTSVLPLLVSGGRIVAQGRYPSRDELSALAEPAPVESSDEPLFMLPLQPGSCCGPDGCC